MKKPINKVALFIWVVAALNAAAQPILEPLLHQWTVAAAPEFQRSDATVHLTLVYWHLSDIRAGVVVTTLLVAAGAMVELLDCIRWDGKVREAGRQR